MSPSAWPRPGCETCSTRRVAHLLPAFGADRIEDVTPASIEAWRASLGADLSSRTKNKLLVVLHGVFRRAQSVWGLP